MYIFYDIRFINFFAGISNTYKLYWTGKLFAIFCVVSTAQKIYRKMYRRIEYPLTAGDVVICMT